MIKIFFVGLLMQFFLQTFVTYQLEWTGKIWTSVWLWKEVFLLIFIGLVIRGLFSMRAKIGKEKFWINLRSHSVFRFLIFFIIAVGIDFLLAVGIQKVGFGAFILSLKYDFLGFLIFLLGVAMVWFLPFPQLDFSRWYQKLFKWVVYGGFIRWGIIYFVPDFLGFFGYSRNVFDGTLIDNPPAVYYTQIDRGLIRNQFLFERPISFGFFLVAFWPLFALGYLRKSSRRKQIFWTIAVGTLVFSTLSRAAIGVWFLQTVILIPLIYRKQVNKLIFLIGVPGFIILSGGLWYFRGTFIREHSNIGHIVLLQEGIRIAMSKPFYGWGAGYSGPASHQICNKAETNSRCELIKEINTQYQITTPGYNPENQYVQIFMEYGLLGVLPWLFCFFWLLWASIKTIKPLMIELKKGKKADQKLVNELCVLFAFGVGLFGLALEGLVLHSFVDRMIVYPMMLLWGISYGKKDNR